jgi:hypothetical protein
MNRSRAVIGRLVLGLCAAAAIAASAQAAERAFFRGYAGSLPTQTRDLAGDYFKKPPVRAVIYALEKGP